MEKKIRYNKVELTSMIKNFNESVTNGLYMSERQKEKDIIQYCSRLNNQQESDACWNSRFVDVMNVFTDTRPTFIAYKLSQLENFEFVVSREVRLVSIEKLWKVVSQVQANGLEFIKWEQIGYSLLVMAGNAIIDNKETPLPIDKILSIRQIKNELQPLYYINSQLVRDMMHCMKINFEKANQKVSVFVTEKSVRKAFSDAIELMPYSHEYKTETEYSDEIKKAKKEKKENEKKA